MSRASSLISSSKVGSIQLITRPKSSVVSQGYYPHPIPVSPIVPQRTSVRQKTDFQVSLASIFTRLKEIAQLEADWDSYGAEPVSSVAFIAAFELLDAVKNRLSRKVREPLPQFIAPLADGGLQLEWSGQKGDIEVEIYPNGDLGYVLIERQGTNRKFKEQHQVSLHEVLNLLSQFLSLEVKE